MKKSHDQNRNQKKLSLKKIKITKLDNSIKIKGGAAPTTIIVITDTFC